MSKRHLARLGLVLGLGLPLAGCDLSTGPGDPPMGGGAPLTDTWTPDDPPDADDGPSVEVFQHQLAGPVAVGAEVDVVLDLPAATDVAAVIFDPAGVFEIADGQIPAVEGDQLTLRLRALSAGTSTMIVGNTYWNTYEDHVLLEAREISEQSVALAGPFWLVASDMLSAAPEGWALGPGGYVDLRAVATDAAGTELIGDLDALWAVSDPDAFVLSGHGASADAGGAIVVPDSGSLRVTAPGAVSAIGVITLGGAPVLEITAIDPVAGPSLVLRGLPDGGPADALVEAYLPKSPDLATGDTLTLPVGDEALYVPTVFDTFDRYVVLPPDACWWTAPDADLLVASDYEALFADPIVVWVAAIGAGETELTVGCLDVEITVPVSIVEP